MHKITTYQDLDLWKEAMILAENIYHITQKFPDTEKFGLVSQMRRATVSIPSNIAEGYRRKGRGEYIQFLSYGYGSASELETQLELSRRLKFLSSKDFEDINKKLQSILAKFNVLIRILKK